MGYVVCANICDGDDYIKHYFGGYFTSYAKAYDFFQRWMPNERSVHRIIKNDILVNNTTTLNYDLQVGLWDFKTGENHEFVSYDLTSTLTSVSLQPAYKRS